MTGCRTFSKKVVPIALILWLALVLCAHGQQKKPAADAKAAPVQGVQPPATAPKSLLVPVPNVVGKTPAEAEMVLKKSGFQMGKVQTTPVGKGTIGTVAKQDPAANSPAAKGSAVDVWIMAQGGLAVKKPPTAAPAQPQPKLYARGKQLFMEFPETVHQVVVFDAQGNVLQQFSNGRRFDITESLIKTNAGRIYLGIAPGPGSPVPMRWDPRDPDRIPFELARYRNLASARIIPEDDTTMGRSEPANDSIGGAPLLSIGYVEGEVGGDDATDFGQVTALADGTGTLVQVDVISGSVQLYLHGPRRDYLDGGASKIWIALAPSTSFYFQVSPTGSASGAYRIRIRKNRLNDAYEANDSLSQARTYGAGQAFLGNVINSSGNHVGFNDYYTIRIDEPKNVRVVVANAGLASGEQVAVSLYDANHTLVATEYYSGNANGCTLTHDLRADWAGVDYPPFPDGDWHILISDSSTNSSGGGSPSAYGLGDPPTAYTRTDGYTLSTTLTP